jgi:hypothetical protein
MFILHCRLLNFYMQWLKGSVFFLPLPDVGAGWCKVEKKFEKLTATTDGYLPLALFAK